MPNKTVTVRVGLDASNALSGMDRLAAKGQQTSAKLKRDLGSVGPQIDLKTPIDKSVQAVDTYGGRVRSGLGRATDAVTKHHEAVGRLGTGYLRAGTIAAAGLAAVGAAAVSWESDFAGVRKTINDTSAGYEELEGELRALAKTLPATHEEIAKVAENAGQLGVARKDIAAFTKTALDLGETTNLSADEAATSLAQLMTVMGTAPDKVSNLGSALVQLGNNGASTEKDILELGQRFAGVARQMNLTEAQTLAFASAITSTGINVEAGGTAISQVFGKIDLAVRSGGDGLKALAEVSGLTTAQFKEQFGKDAAGAVDLFVQGLGSITKEGGDVRSILGDIGVKGQYQTDVLQRLAGATKNAGSQTNLLSDALEQGSRGFEENTALLEEANKRYDTTAARVEIAWNQIKDAAITAGEVLLPIVADIASSVGAIADAFGSLPEPVQTAALSLAGAVTVLGLVGGGGLKAIAGLGAARTAFVELGLSARASGIAIKAATLSIPVLGIALFAAGEVMAHFAKQEGQAAEQATTFDSAVQSMTGTIDRNTAAMNGNVRAAAAKALQDNGAFALADKLGLSYATVTNSVLGQQDALDIVNGKILEYSKLGPYATKADGERRNAAIELSKALNGTANAELESIRKANEVKQATEGKTAASEDAAVAAAELSSAESSLVKQQTALANETQKVINKFTVLKDGALDSEQAANQLTTALLGVTDSVKDNGTSLSQNTRSGVANRQAIIANVTAINDKITADFKATEKAKGLDVATKEASKRLKQQRQDLIENAVKAGLNRKQVTDMVDAMLQTPEELKTNVKTPGVTDAQAEIKELEKRIRDLKNKSVDVGVNVKFDANKLAASVIKGDYFNNPGAYTPSAKGGAIPKTNNQAINNRNGVQWRAYGGAVQNLSGKGRQAYDTEPAMLRVDEHVWTPEEVDAAGGHDAMYRMRQAALRGEFRGYAQGGKVLREIDIHANATKVRADLAGMVDAAATNSRAAGGAYAQDVVDALVKAANKKLAENVVGAFGRIDVGNPRGLTTFRGKTFTNLFAASLRAAEVDAGRAFSIFQGGFRPATSYSGTSHAGDAVDTQVDAALLRAARKHGIAMWDRTGKGNWVPHQHGVPLPGAGFAGGSGVWQAQDYLRGGDGLAQGGIVKGGRGGARRLIGEGPYDELVTPLPHGWNLAKYAQGGRVAPTLAGMMIGSYAAGGAVTGVGYGADLTALFRLVIRQISAPLKQLGSLTRAVKQAEDRLKAVRVAGAPAQRAYAKADRRYDNAREAYAADRADQARDKLRNQRKIREQEVLYKRLDKAGDRTKGRTKEDVAAEKAKKRLDALRAAEKKRAQEAAGDNAKSRKQIEDLAKVRERAQQARGKASEKEKAAADRLKDAQQALADQQKQLAEDARQASQGFQDMYRSASTDARDWLDSLKQGAVDLTAFRAKIDQLRKAGLSNDLIEQIIGQGAQAGSETADSILRGNLVKQLNDANKKLVGAADILGYSQVTQTVAPGILTKMIPGQQVTTNGQARSNITLTPQIDVSPTIYVQNPFTAQFFRAEMKKVAKEAVVEAARTNRIAYDPSRVG